MHDRQNRDRAQALRDRSLLLGVVVIAIVIFSAVSDSFFNPQNVSLILPSDPRPGEP